MGAAATAVLSATIVVAAAVSSAYADPTPTNVDQQLSTAWQQLEVVIEQYNAAQEVLSNTNAQLNAVQTQIAPLQSAVAAAEQKADQISSAMYKGAQIGGLSALIGSPTPQTFIDQLAVLAHLESDRHKQLAQLWAGRDRLLAEQQQLTALSSQKTQEADALGKQKSAIQGQINRLEALGGRPGHGTPRSPAGAINDGYVPAFTADPAGEAVRFAYDQLGKAYKFATAGPSTFDCSGLVMASWRAAGVSLPHNAAEQYRTVTPITRDQLRPGDLVFYYRDIHHVALYIGNDRVIEAPQPGEKVSMRPIGFAPIAGYGRPRGQ